GMTAANEILGRPFDRDELVNFAAEMEGHPDNVTPAFAGGLCAAVTVGQAVTFVSWKTPGLFTRLSFVFGVPAVRLVMADARRVVPGRLARGDSVFSLGRTALLLSALANGRRDLLSTAMEDRFHQPQRAKLIRGFRKVMDSAKKAGAHGACLSGAGPSVLAV